MKEFTENYFNPKIHRVGPDDSADFNDVVSNVLKVISESRFYERGDSLDFTVNVLIFCIANVVVAEGFGPEEVDMFVDVMSDLLKKNIETNRTIDDRI